MNVPDAKTSSASNVDRVNARGPLGTFLASLHKNEACAAPPELRRLAMKALTRNARRGDDSLADDLVNELLTRLITPRKDGRPARLGELVELPEDSLRKLLGRSIRNIAAELTPRWNTYKLLRENVTAALKKKPAANAKMPVDLLEDGRFNGARVAAAVAAMLNETGSRPGATELTRRLFEDYFPADVPIEKSPAAMASSAADQGDQVCDALDAVRAEERIRHCLGAELSRFISQRVAGWGYQAIADANDCSLAKAHHRVGLATERLAPVAGAFTMEAMDLALIALAKDVEVFENLGAEPCLT